MGILKKSILYVKFNFFEMKMMRLRTFYRTKIFRLPHLENFKQRIARAE